jgi:metal-responsive CopG/Arc/MetJ family transcriptional regulator
MMGKGKNGSLYLDVDIWNKIDEIVAKKQMTELKKEGKVRSNRSSVIEEIIREYLETHTEDD